MTRRGFFRLFGLAVVTAPATATLLPDKLASVRRWWVPTQWWTREFDWATKIGVCGAFRNVLTGETIRHAVRMDSDGTVYRKVFEVEDAKILLQAWADGLPAWRLPARPGHGHFDDVLEGHELSPRPP